MGWDGLKFLFRQWSNVGEKKEQIRGLYMLISLILLLSMIVLRSIGIIEVKICSKL